MLKLVHLFVFEEVEAVVLCVTSHKRKGSFTQVIFQKAVAGMYQVSVFGLEIRMDNYRTYYQAIRKKNQ